MSKNIPASKKRNKYNACRVVIDGTKYDSKKEAARGEELKMLERAGHIRALRFQVPFVLQPSFKHEGKTIRAIEYVADAVYILEGIEIVEDTKSEHTRKLPVFKMKKKMFLYKYPDKVFREYV